MRPWNTSLILSLVLSLASVFAAPAHASLTDDDAKLLDKLVTLRAATITDSGAGRGTGVVKFERTSPQMAKEGAGPFKVEFAFSDKTAIRWETDPKSGELRQAFLQRDDKQVCYYAGDKLIPAAVTIESKLRRGLGSAPLQQWTFAEVGRIPWNFQDRPEREDMASLTKTTDVSLEKKGDVIRLTSVVGNERKRPGTKGFRVVVVANFDLTLGGMLTEYSERQEVLHNDDRKEIREVDTKIDWKVVDDHVVPTLWRCHELFRWPDGREVDTLNEATFETFKIERVPESEFSMDKLGIRRGTIVADTILGTQYKYPPTTVPTTQGNVAPRKTSRQETKDSGEGVR